MDFGMEECPGASPARISMDNSISTLFTKEKVSPSASI
jgi:hypothetical protein